LTGERLTTPFEMTTSKAASSKGRPSMLASRNSISQPGRLGDLLVGEVDSDHPSGVADLESGAERICSGARSEVEHPVSGCERGEVEVVADAGERRQGLGGYRVEELVWVAKSQRELPPDRKVELCFLLPRYLAIHVLHLRLEDLTVDEGAGVRLWQRRRESHLVLGGDPIRTHLDLLPGETRSRQCRTNRCPLSARWREVRQDAGPESRTLFA
jgi:hypothetical protein